MAEYVNALVSTDTGSRRHTHTKLASDDQRGENRVDRDGREILSRPFLVSFEFVPCKWIANSVNK